MDSNLFILFKNYKIDNNSKKLEEIYLYFKEEIYNISKGMPYEEGHSDLIIEFIKLLNSSKLNHCVNSAHLEGSIIIILKYKKLDIIKKNNKKVIECTFSDELINEKFFYSNYDLLVYDLFTNLNDNQREIMELSFIHNYSDVEIAQLKNKSKQNIGQTKKRAIKILQKFI